MSKNEISVLEEEARGLGKKIAELQAKLQAQPPPADIKKLRREMTDLQGRHKLIPDVLADLRAERKIVAERTKTRPL